MTYRAIEEAIQRHQVLRSKLEKLQKALDEIDGEGQPKMGDLGDTRKDFSMARITVPVRGGVEEFDLPIKDCRDLIQGRYDEYKKDFDKLDRKIQKWHKEAS